jgi:REP-associated tyrosine transposase
MHIVQRGHNRGACFLEGSGFELYLGLLNELRERFACRIHAYVLMTNHVHLLLTPDEADGASELLRRVNLRFVQAMNRRYGRSGPGWDSRFWSSVIETGRYFLACQRYIELNPVRAGLASAPDGYAWSSHRFNAYGARDPMLEPHAEYMALGGNAATRRAAYRALFLEKLADDQLSAIRKAARSGFPYGSEDFVQELELRTGRRLRRGKPGPKAAAAILSCPP